MDTINTEIVPTTPMGSTGSTTIVPELPLLQHGIEQKSVAILVYDLEIG